MAARAAKTVFCLLLAGLLLHVLGCAMYMAPAFKYSKAEGGVVEEAERLPGDPQQFTSSAAEVTLAWDAPPSSTSGYRVLFRVHGTSSWYSLIDELNAESQPQYTVQRGAVGCGLFDFGVVAVSAEHAESPLHNSLETTAQPDTGWYLVWEE